MDTNLLLLVLLGSAIVFLAGLAGYKVWFDNRTKRNTLAKLAGEISAVQHRKRRRENNPVRLPNDNVRIIFR